MKPQRISRWAGASLMLSTLALGCMNARHAQNCHTCTACNACGGVATAAAPAPVVVRSQPGSLTLPEKMAVIPNMTTMPAPTRVTPAPLPAMSGAPVTQPPVTKTPLTSIPNVGSERYVLPEKPTESKPQSAIPMPEKVITADQPEPKPIAIESGSAGGYGRAEDYSWLSGELIFHPTKKQWRLRYAAIDEVDPYGGSVTLHGLSRQLEEMKTGSMIRIEGSLIDSETRQSSPGYRVRDIQVLNK